MQHPRSDILVSEYPLALTPTPSTNISIDLQGHWTRGQAGDLEGTLRCSRQSLCALGKKPRSGSSHTDNGRESTNLNIRTLRALFSSEPIENARA